VILQILILFLKTKNINKKPEFDFSDKKIISNFLKNILP